MAKVNYDPHFMQGKAVMGPFVLDIARFASGCCRGLRRPACVALIAFAVTIPGAVAAQGNGQRGAYVSTSGAAKGITRAVVAGISAYPMLTRQQQLSYAHRDAELMAEYLVQSGMITDTTSIRLLRNEQATASAILMQIDEYLRMSRPNDQLIIYFAGHGDVARDEARDEEDAYLLCHNAATDADYAISDAISLSRLQNIIAAAAKNKIRISLITDACRSGKIPSTEEAAKATSYILANSWSQVAKLASCGAEEVAYEDTLWGTGHGVFTYFLVKGLSADADAEEEVDSLVTRYELNAFLKKKVRAETKKHKPTIQTPAFIGGDDNEVIAGLLRTELKPNLYFPSLGDDGMPGRKDRSILRFDHTGLQDAWQNFIRFAESGHLSDSAYDAYRRFSLLAPHHAYTPRLRNDLVLLLVASAQTVIDQYLRGGNDVPPASAFRKASHELKVAQELYGRKNLISKQWRSNELFLQAFSYLAEERWEKYREAEALLRKALKLDKRGAYIYQALGKLYGDTEHYEKSEKYLLRAIALAPRWTFPRSDLGNTYFDMGKWDASIEQFEAAIIFDKTLSKAYNNLSRVYLEQGKLSLSEAYFKKADSLKPFNKITTTNLAIVYKLQGRIPEALAKFEEAIALDSNYYLPYHRLGEYYLNESGAYNKGPTSLAYLSRANRLSPYMEETTSSLAYHFEVYRASTQSSEEAKRLYARAISLRPNIASNYYRLAVVQQADHDTRTAGRTISRMMRRNKWSSDAYYHRALFNQYLKKQDRAEADFRKALALNVYEKSAYTDLADHLEKQKRLGEAEAVLRQMLDQFHDSPEVLYRLATFYLRHGNWNQAEEWLRKAIATDPSYSFAWSSLAYGRLRHTTDAESALAAFREARKLNPNKHDPLEFAAILRLKADSIIAAGGPIETAIRIYNPSLELDPSKSHGVNYAIAKAFYLRGDPDNARKYIDAIQNPMSYSMQELTRSLLWKVMLDEGQLAGAAGRIEAEMEETQFPSYAGKAILLYLSGNKAEAILMMKREKTENPALLEQNYLRKNYSDRAIQIINALSQ